MENKSIHYVALVVVVIIGIVWCFVSFDLFGTNSPKSFQGIQNTQNSRATETPNFIMGVVSRVEGQKVFVKIGEEEKVVNTDNKTLITKQIREGGKFRNISGNFAEIKDSQRVVVYYDGEPSDSEYKASKIQILNF
jgi:hypothetical protein